MIEPEELVGVDDGLARRILIGARSIAHSIDSLEGDARKNVLAVLLGVAAEAPAPGMRRAKSFSRNGTTLSFSDGAGNAGLFSQEDRDALRALTGSNLRGGLPVGSFPEPHAVGRMWPETYT